MERKSVHLKRGGLTEVSSAYSDHNDNPLVLNTFDKALAANPGAPPLFHSDYAEENTMPKFLLTPVFINTIQISSA